MDDNLKAGPTGEYPNGKLDEDDAGGLGIRLDQWGDKLRVDFGTELSWLGMNRAEALELGEALVSFGSGGDI